MPTKTDLAAARDAWRRKLASLTPEQRQQAADEGLAAANQIAEEEARLDEPRRRYEAEADARISRLLDRLPEVVSGLRRAADLTRGATRRDERGLLVALLKDEGQGERFGACGHHRRAFLEASATLRQVIHECDDVADHEPCGVWSASESGWSEALPGLGRDVLHALTDALARVRLIIDALPDGISPETIAELEADADRLAELVRDDQPDDPSSGRAQAPASTSPETPKLPRLQPHDRQAWQLSLLADMTQHRVADALNEEHGTNYSQGQVHRMIKRVEKHADASGLSDLVREPADRELTMDPAKLELGSRTRPDAHHLREADRKRSDDE